MPWSLSHCADPLKLAKWGRFAKHEKKGVFFFTITGAKKEDLRLVGLLETLGWSSFTDLTSRKVIQDQLCVVWYLAKKLQPPLPAVAVSKL